MKNNNLTLFLKNPTVNGTIVLDTAYEVTVNGEKKKRVLTEKGTVVEVSPKSEVAKLEVILSPKNLWSYKINLDLEGKDKEALRKWVKESPYLSKEGSPDNTTFCYRFDDEVIEESSTTDEEKAEVYSKYKLLTEDERIAVSVHFGVPPFDVSEKELMNHLVGLSGGLITSSPELRNEFLNHLDRIFDEVALNFRCAVQEGVVSKSDSGVYTMNGEVLGSSLDASILLVKQREDLFSVIKRELTNKGKFLTTRKKGVENKQEQKKQEQKKAVEDELDGLEVAPKRGRKAETA